MIESGQDGAAARDTIAADAVADAAAAPEEPAAAAAAHEDALRGFFGSLGEVLLTLVAMTHTRLELMFTDLQEAASGLLQLLLWSLLALFFASAGMLIGGLALIFAYWETHRVLVSVLVMCGFLALGLLAALVALSRLRAQRSVFAATVAEFIRDRQLFKAPP
jgi:uncharacterized membrane protein YqjE